MRWRLLRGCCGCGRRRARKRVARGRGSGGAAAEAASRAAQSVPPDRAPRSRQVPSAECDGGAALRPGRGERAARRALQGRAARSAGPAHWAQAADQVSAQGKWKGDRGSQVGGAEACAESCTFTYTIKYADNAKTVLTEKKLYAEVADSALQLPLHELHA